MKRMVGRVLNGNGITPRRWPRQPDRRQEASGRVLPEKRWGCDGDASEGPRYRENNCSPALPARRVVNDLLTLPLAQRLELVQSLWDSIGAEQIGPELTEADRQLIDQRLERFLADGDPGLDAGEVMGA
jgi:putative addiction module component (TIGR02574 family)